MPERGRRVEGVCVFVSILLLPFPPAPLLGRYETPSSALQYGAGQNENAPHRLFRSKLARMGGALNSRRCCWRSWRWRRHPCWSYRWRPLTCVCAGGGRDHWPAGEHRCDPPYGTPSICEWRPEVDKKRIRKGSVYDPVEKHQQTCVSSEDGFVRLI